MKNANRGNMRGLTRFNICCSEKPDNNFAGTFVFVRLFSIIILTVFMSFSVSCFAQRKIYIVTDMEGISGVFRWKQCNTKDSPLYDQVCEYFMGDLSAVVRGLKECGATEIIVLDGHGYQNVLPHLMERGVKYITGTPRPDPLSGFDETFDGVIQLGAHAKEGTSDGVLNHTQSNERKFRFWYNGVETGEIGMVALAAGYYDVPVIMVAGDKAVCREARNLLEDQVVTVAVKEGIAEEAAILYPFDETRQALYEGAKRAMSVIDQCRPYKIKNPFTVKLEYVSSDEDTGKLKVIEQSYPDASHIYDILQMPVLSQ